AAESRSAWRARRPTLLLCRNCWRRWRGRLFADLFEILLYVGLERHRHFVAIDLRTALGVLSALVHVIRAELLIGGLHFHRRLAGNVLRPLAHQLGQLSHGCKLLRILDRLVAVLTADAAAGLLGGLLRITLALTLLLLGVFV